MSYAILKGVELQSPPYSLTSIRGEDMEPIRKWRNEQIALLRQDKPLSEEDQEQYFKEIVSPGFNSAEPDQLLFSLFKKEKLIGYGGLTHIDWTGKKGEVSFLLETGRTDRPVTYREDFSLFLQLIKLCAFHHLHFHRLWTETYDLRPAHVAVLEAEGFKPEGRLKDHHFIDGRYVDTLFHGCLEGSDA